jgi:hypothetical protein
MRVRKIALSLFRSAKLLKIIDLHNIKLLIASIINVVFNI